MNRRGLNIHIWCCMVAAKLDENTTDSYHPFYISKLAKFAIYHNAMVHAGPHIQAHACTVSYAMFCDLIYATKRQLLYLILNAFILYKFAILYSFPTIYYMQVLMAVYNTL